MSKILTTKKQLRGGDWMGKKVLRSKQNLPTNLGQPTRKERRTIASQNKNINMANGTLLLAKLLQKSMIEAREKGEFPVFAIYNKTTDNPEIEGQILPPCKEIKSNGPNGIVAVFYDPINDVDFIGNLHRHSENNCGYYTMEVPQPGKYSTKPVMTNRDIGHLVWEMEHWLTALFEYADKNNIQIEWKELNDAWRNWQTLPVETKLGFPEGTKEYIDKVAEKYSQPFVDKNLALAKKANFLVAQSSSYYLSPKAA